MLRSRNILIIVFCLTGVLFSLRLPQLRSERWGGDFQVYYTAGFLVRLHEGASIYNGADDGTDPQQKPAIAGSRFADVAASIGLPEVSRYVYPPFFADICAPLSALSLHTAEICWQIMNGASLCLIAVLCSDLLSRYHKRIVFFVILVGLLLSMPIQEAFIWGQVTIQLLLLCTAGIYLYYRGQRALSGICFALAAAIKVTPAMILLPFMIWKEVRWLVSFAASTICLFLIECYVNSVQTLHAYFFRMAPAMSRGIPQFYNHSLLSSMQIAYGRMHGMSHDALLLQGAPSYVNTISKAISLCILGFFCLFTFKSRDRVNQHDRAVILSAFILLSIPLSPVSWAHAYVLGALAVVFCWAELMRQEHQGLAGVVVACGLLEITTLPLNLFIKGPHEITSAILGALAPAASVFLTFWMLYRACHRARSLDHLTGTTVHSLHEVHGRV